MRRLGLLRRINRLREGRDRGTVALLVAVLIGSGVLLGCAALTIDVGNLQAERRQLQNGADAAAYSAMSQCAKGTCPTAAGLQGLTGQNAADGFTYVRRVDGGQAVCGQVSAPATIPSCSALLGGVADLNDCPTPPSLPAQWVRVYTQTELKDGSTILPYYFAQTLTGAQSDRTQQTCASAGLVGGYPAITLPVTNSMCSWNAATANGTKFAPLPPYSPAPKAYSSPPGPGPVPTLPASLATYATQINEQGTKADSDSSKCKSSTSGQYISGGFGWLASDGTCHADINADTGIVSSDPGGSIPSDCKNVIAGLVGTIVYIPIFTEIDGSGGKGSGGWFRIDGVAAFYLAGYGSPAAKPKSYDGYTSSLGCDGASYSCLWGWYVAPIDTDLHKGGGTDRGPKSIITLG